MTPRVLISDKLSPAAVAIFKERGVQVDVKPGLDKEELAKIIGGYDGLAIRSATKVTAKLLGSATKLKVVGRAGIGVDNVDIPAATARGVIVMNTPFGNSITTAEHAIALMFALARQIPSADVSTRGKVEKNRFMGVELTGKTLRIIVVEHRRDRGLAGLRIELRVVAFDPFLSLSAQARRRKARAQRSPRARRFHHPPHAADGADAQHSLGGKFGEDQAWRSHHQLRPRRPCR
jgi:D-3-phosphoglycerate dehydrogenase